MYNFKEDHILRFLVLELDCGKGNGMMSYLI